MPSAPSSMTKKKPLYRRRPKARQPISSASIAPMTARERAHCRAHHYWMIATLAAFPVGLGIVSYLGLGPTISFLAGAVGSLLVLFLNILLEREFWMLESHWKARFEDPDFSHRLLVVSGALLLMVQTSFLVFFLLDQPFATKVVKLLVTARL